MEVGTPTHFTIYTKGAGKAKPEVHFAAPGPGEAVRDFEIIDNHDYSYTVKYTALQQVLKKKPRNKPVSFMSSRASGWHLHSFLPSKQGNMTISVTHGGDPIPKSPFHITVAPPLDIGKVKVEGLDNRTS